MNLAPEQRAFREAIRDFSVRECGTRAQREAWLDPGEEDHSTPLYEQLAELGWLGVAIPEEYGGAGGAAEIDEMGGAADSVPPLASRAEVAVG